MCQLLPGLLAVAGSQDLKAPVGEGLLQERARRGIVFGDEYSHAKLPGRMMGLFLKTDGTYRKSRETAGTGAWGKSLGGADPAFAEWRQGRPVTQSLVASSLPRPFLGVTW